MADKYVLDRALSDYDADSFKDLLPKTATGRNALDALVAQKQREIEAFEKQFAAPTSKYNYRLSKEEREILSNFAAGGSTAAAAAAAVSPKLKAGIAADLS